MKDPYRKEFIQGHVAQSARTVDSPQVLECPYILTSPAADAFLLGAYAARHGIKTNAEIHKGRGDHWRLNGRMFEVNGRQIAPLDLLKSLRERLPKWYFQPYGADGAVACFPAHPMQPSPEAFRQLDEHAAISAVCGAFYVVTELRKQPDPDNDLDDDDDVLGCPKCGHEWPAEDGPPCPKCGH